VPTDLFFATSGGATDNDPYNSGNVRMVVTSAGKVGVGTTNPPAWLSVQGTDAGHVSAQFQADPASDILYVGTTPTWSGISSYTSAGGGGGATSVLALNQNGGNVGIGVANPGAPLHVEGANQWGSIVALRKAPGMHGIGIGEYYGYPSIQSLLGPTMSGGEVLGLNNGGGNILMGTPTAPSNVGINVLNPPAFPLTVMGDTNGVMAGFFSNGGQAVGFESNMGSNAVNLQACDGTPTTPCTGTIPIVLDYWGGNVGVGPNANPAHTLDVTGDLNVTGSYLYNGACQAGACSSDIRLKTDVHPFAPGLDGLLKISPKWYKYNGLGEQQKTDTPAIGVIAQDVEKGAPELISTKPVKLHPEDKETTEIKRVNYSGLIYVVINAVKELYHRWFDDSQAIHQELQKVEAENAKLKARIEHLEQVLGSH
jgi:hypothetical protein